jgi:hypothetical protein
VRSCFRTGFGGIDEDLKGLVAAIFIDGDEGFPERGFDAVGIALENARARLFSVFP